MTNDKRQTTNGLLPTCCNFTHSSYVVCRLSIYTAQPCKHGNQLKDYTIMPNPTSSLTVIARAPFTVYYEGPAHAVSARNRVGPFDVLPGHADFFSMLIPCDVIIETDKDPITFPIQNGIVTVRDNTVMLFVDI